MAWHAFALIPANQSTKQLNLLVLIRFHSLSCLLFRMRVRVCVSLAAAAKRAQEDANSLYLSAYVAANGPFYADAFVVEVLSRSVRLLVPRFAIEQLTYVNTLELSKEFDYDEARNTIQLHWLADHDKGYNTHSQVSSQHTSQHCLVCFRQAADSKQHMRSRFCSALPRFGVLQELKLFTKVRVRVRAQFRRQQYVNHLDLLHPDEPEE